NRGESLAAVEDHRILERQLFNQSPPEASCELVSCEIVAGVVWRPVQVQHIHCGFHRPEVLLQEGNSKRGHAFSVWRMTSGAAFWSCPDESEISSPMRWANPGTGVLPRHPYRCSRHP